MIPPPDYTESHWNIRAADNKVRVVLMKRHDINYYYTSLEQYDSETERWSHIKGSSSAHTQSESKAIARVERLLKTYRVFG